MKLKIENKYYTAEIELKDDEYMNQRYGSDSEFVQETVAVTLNEMISLLYTPDFFQALLLDINAETAQLKINVLERAYNSLDTVVDKDKLH
ncbi:MAG: hypothetical protein Q8R37_05760 [Nanoarchaeota archaeon]|nr:hypothetical protein [Nanoarchaeota archaeon]